MDLSFNSWWCFYTFPLGGMTAIVGDNTDGGVYSLQLVFTVASNTLDDCGNVNAGITNGGAMAGASYDFGNGFTTALVMQALKQASWLKNTTCIWFNAAYTADDYGLSVTYGLIETGTNGVNENVTQHWMVTIHLITVSV